MAHRRHRITDRETAQACVEIAKEVHLARYLSGDDLGASAARQVAQSIEDELLRALSERIESGASFQESEEDH